MSYRKLAAVVFVLALFGAVVAQADTALRPYILGSNAEGSLADKVTATKTALKENGFSIVGQYAPFAGVKVLAITNTELKNTAAKTAFGGYGAVIRVGLTESAGKVQVAYNNPKYLTNVYRLSGNLSGTAGKLAIALGNEKEFGSEKGLTAEKLRKYKYMPMMPKFDDQDLLAEHGSYDDAVAAVKAGLTAGNGGTAKVYEVEIPGKDETLFGVAVKAGKGADKTVMGNCDKGELKHSAHLPYELLVSGNKVYALKGKFRIAQSFPDLTMGTFMKISSAPDAIKTALEKAAGPGTK
jgi:hypothetical protein